MACKLIAITPEAEKLIMYCARVSSNDQESTDSRLINYCIKHGHYSILEMANMVVEINTSRAISAQILRHRSFSFQEFSQRYAKTQGFESYEARSQDTKNRQNSNDDMSEQDKDWFERAQNQVHSKCDYLYKEALGKGIAKEQARFLLPMSTSTKIYMNGSLRSWVHYLQLRTGNGTQKEHMDLANEIKAIFIKELPILGEAVWPK